VIGFWLVGAVIAGTLGLLILIVWLVEVLGALL
jgi:hypothetical protein